MEEFPGFGPDFSSLAEKSEPDFEKKDKKDAKKAKKASLFERGNQTEAKGDDKSEKTPETPKDPPLEKLADDEKQMVVSARKKEVGQELITTAPDSVAEKEALVAATFLEVLETEVADVESIDDALDISEEKALDIAGLEAETAEPEQEEDKPVAGTPIGGSGATAPPLHPSLPLASGGGTTPPSGPNGSGRGFGGMSGAGGPAFSAGNSPQATPNVMPTINTSGERYAARRGLLIGGLIGYMIGRRRGRIKTEKKLLPIQHKLEKQVTDLQQKIAFREEKIRQIVRRQVENSPQMQQNIVERMKKLQELKHNHISAESINQSTPKQPEKFGKFAMLGEERREERFKTSEAQKDVGLMTVSELLVIAEKITLEQSTVKKLFEANRLNDEGLRRVIRAFLRGERYDHVINDNLKTPENLTASETIQTNGGRQSAGYHQDNNYVTSTAGSTFTPSSTSSQTNQPSNLPTTQLIPDDSKQNHPLRAIITIAIIIAIVLLIFIGR